MRKTPKQTSGIDPLWVTETSLYTRSGARPQLARVVLFQVEGQ